MHAVATRPHARHERATTRARDLRGTTSSLIGQKLVAENLALNEVEYREAQEQYGDDFVAGMGGSREELLARNRLNKLNRSSKAIGATRANRFAEAGQAAQLVQDFKIHASRLDGSQCVASHPPDSVTRSARRPAFFDFGPDDLYRRVINRNNRLKNLLCSTPDVIIRNSECCRKPLTPCSTTAGTATQLLVRKPTAPSLSDMLKGKGGRFHQNLTRKARRLLRSFGYCHRLSTNFISAVCRKDGVGPFEPFIIRRLKTSVMCTPCACEKMIERQTPEVWDILDEVTKAIRCCSIAPTLHRL
jgi:DNA-directed RNA polymerase subunit beta'